LSPDKKPLSFSDLGNTLLRETQYFNELVRSLNEISQQLYPLPTADVCAAHENKKQRIFMRGGINAGFKSVGKNMNLRLLWHSKVEKP